MRERLLLSLFGIVVFSLAACSGESSGDSLNGSVTAAVHADLDGTVVDEHQIDGTYSLAAAGACPNDSGSFHFTR